jgi:RNA polymerase sigma factor (sigma-70 family)
MPINGTSKVIRQLWRESTQDPAGLTDRELLECFVADQDPVAAEVLVRRHAPMVWGVCRRILVNQHDVEDAFQATFLVFLRKAGSIRTTAGNWLYGVAHQTALKARSNRAKRQTRETSVESPDVAVAEHDRWNDLKPLLDKELSLLPESHRAAIVLCDLEAKSIKEAARELGCPEGTVASRLSRARTMLAKRLSRHGLPVSAVALAAILLSKAMAASELTVVTNSTVNAMTSLVAGQAPSSLISKPVTTLAEGVTRAMFLTKLKTAVVGVLSLLVVVAIATNYFVRPGQAAASLSPPTNSGVVTGAERVGMEDKYEEFARFKHTGGAASITTIKDKGGFSVVLMDTAEGRTKMAISFTVKENERPVANFRIFAVDKAGNRHSPKGENKVSGGGSGVTLITAVCEFSLASDNIETLLIQQQQADK